MKQRLNQKVVDELKPRPKLYKVWDSKKPGFFVKVRPSGTKSYGLFYRVDGKAAEFTIGSTAKLKYSKAKELADERFGQIAQGRDPQAERQAGRRQEAIDKSRTVGRFLDDRYYPQKLAQYKTGANTAHRLRTVWAHLLERDLADITAEEIEAWRTKRLQEVKPATINRDVNALRGLLSKAVAWGVIDLHPLRTLSPQNLKEPKVHTRYLLEDERKRLIQAMNDREDEARAARKSGNEWRRERGYAELAPHGWFSDHLVPMVVLAMNTGMRFGELTGLRWSDIDFDDKKAITVRADIAKSGDDRDVALNNTSAELLRKWRTQVPAYGYVFPGKDGGRINNITKAWGTLRRKAELKNFRFHDLRHEFATKALRGGADIVEVKELLGHSDIALTMRYAHVMPEAKAEAVAALDKVDDR